MYCVWTSRSIAWKNVFYLKLSQTRYGTAPFCDVHSVKMNNEINCNFYNYIIYHVYFGKTLSLIGQFSCCIHNCHLLICSSGLGFQHFLYFHKFLTCILWPNTVKKKWIEIFDKIWEWLIYIYIPICQGIPYPSHLQYQYFNMNDLIIFIVSFFFFTGMISNCMNSI